MDEQKQQPQEEGYKERPAWQILAARIGLILFIGLVILQIVQMYRGFR